MAKFYSKKKKQSKASKKKKFVRDKSVVPKQLKKKKDIGVPFKSDAQKPLHRVKNTNRIQKRQKSKVFARNKTLSNILLNAVKRGDEFVEEDTTEESTVEGKFNANQIFKNCYKEFKKVVEAADVIIEVLDARDPLGSRCQQVEQSVISAGSDKRLILLLNKIDLIPRNNLEQWLKYLRQEFPTVAFKACTQSQNDNLSQCSVAAIHMSDNLQSSRRCIGANFLMKVLGNYCRNKDILTSIRVGVVGFPNVGKSSIINSLKRSRTCVVGATPGVTKSMQEIILDKHIRLLDSPGVVFAKEGTQSSLALRNAVKVETLDDVITPTEAIIQRADKTQLCSHYQIPEFSTVQELLFLLAKKMGRLKKGGIPDPEAAARRLLNDWNSGVIKYYTHPPEVYQPSVHISAEIVKEMSAAFDISALEEQMELDKMDNEFATEGVLMKSEGIVNCSEDMDVEHEKMPCPESFEEVASASSVSVSFDSKKKARDCKDYAVVNVLQFQKNKQRRKQFKQMKKKRKRNDKVAASLSDKMHETLSLLM